MKFNNIIIVGGGSAGWMSAATLIKAFPDKKITVVESPNIPTVGVGESTTQLMRRWMHYIGVSDQDLITKCNATHKLSIRFENFHKNDGKGFHYPFGRLDQRFFSISDWFAHQHISKVPFEEFVNDVSPISYCLDNNKVPNSSLVEGGTFLGELWNLEKDSAWHFDSNKFHKYLKDDYCLPKGVNHIYGNVITANTDNSGFITSIITDNGEITGDIFFDCTGFKRVLIEGVMKDEWQGFNNDTYTNAAWAAARPYKNKKEELKLYTNSVALGHGWVWETPTWERIGTGYSYASNYINKEAALSEFKQYLGPISEEMEFRHIDMRNGMSNNFWVKNCISIGLSGAFIEPLESNGLLSVHEFLLTFVNIAEGKDVLNNFDAHSFNHVCREQFLYFADFLTLHYAMTVRDDTQYWRDIQMQNFTDSRLLKQIYDLRGASFYEIPNKLSADVLGATIFLLAGHNVNPYSSFKKYNSEFWGSNIITNAKELDTIIKSNNLEKQRITNTYPDSIDYYKTFH
tara:strand:- start:75 stop:1619 length:1545 start_codon:yes stop_codon:yes gene_type:complete